MEKNYIKKSIAISIIVLFLEASVSSVYGDQPIDHNSLNFGDILYVGGSGPGNYSTIQDAIDNAHDGDTVFVYHGIYKETINVTKAINLTGENLYSTIIDGTDQWFILISIIAEGRIIIKNFTIQNTGIAIDLTDISTQYITIRNNIIKNNNYGIMCDCNSMTITNRFEIYYNYIENNKFVGVSLWGIGKSHVEIHGNTIVKNEIGIKVDSSDMTSSITSNNISHNTQGIYFDSVKDCTIHYNKIDNNYEGIYFIDFTTKNLLTSNNITNNGGGIYLEGTSIRNEIKENNFINNTQAAFFKQCFINRWNENYWDTWIGLKVPPTSLIRFLPKAILGRYGPILWFNFDWYPASKPYDINLPWWN